MTDFPIETNSSDDQVLLDAGYQPRLSRSLGLFASFAVSFSFISITTGIFGNYGYVLTKAGPFGIWTWLLAAMGQMLVALVYAELAGRIPLAGSTYNWNTKLAHPAVGWFTGWLYICTISIGLAAVDLTATTVIGNLIGKTFTPLQTDLVTSVLIVAQAIINIYGVRLTSRINSLAVWSEVISIIVLGVFIIAMAWHHGDIHPELLVKIPDTPKPYWLGFLLAFLMGSWNLVGFETSADMSEETQNARAIAPKGVISSMLAAGLFGLFFLIALTVSIPDVATITASDNPLVAIATYHLGDTVTKIFLIFVVIAVFSCGLILITSVSRIVYAIARDDRFPVASLFKKVSQHQVPVAATCLTGAAGIIWTVLSDNLTTLFAATAIMPAVVYLITVISFAVGYKRLPPTTTFSLGPWRAIVVYASIVWLILEIAILTLPEEFHAAAYASLGLIVLGLLLYPFVGRPRHQDR
jgi:amino acid transporter